MSSYTSSKDLLSSDNIRKAFSIDNPRMSQRLANKKAPKEKPATQPVVGDTLGLSQPETDLVGPSPGYSGNPDSEHRPSGKLLRLVDGDPIKSTHDLETTGRYSEPNEADLENTRSATMTAAGQSSAFRKT